MTLEWPRRGRPPVKSGTLPSMGYKLLGFAVWQGAKWYLRRRLSDTRTKAAVAGVGVAVLAGAALAGRQAAAGSD